ncbi:MAG: hypothetical protein M3Z05_17190 [Gemmatimonadota bacterium]|nr:hypothetical protein [Gemmatimonadota bacterium]
MTTAQGETSALHLMQAQEASVTKQLATAEGRLKSYEQQWATMSSAERDLNLLVRQNRQSDVAELRGQLDQVRQNIKEVQSGATPSGRQVIARAADGPVIVTDVPATVGTTEPPLTIFGLTPQQLRGPAEFVLIFPLMLALSRWIWRRSSDRPSRVQSLEGNPQINRLEQAVESIAIEVERIGEAQRFSAKLMAERPKEPVIERIREPVRGQRRVVTPLP